MTLVARFELGDMVLSCSVDSDGCEYGCACGVRVACVLGFLTIRFN